MNFTIFVRHIVPGWLPLLVILGSLCRAGFIDSYTARLGTDDHYSSRGIPLRHVADILQQDRANFHRFGIRDREDQSDSYFSRRSRRARIGRMLRRGWIEPGLGEEILIATPLVKVDIYSDHLEVRHVENDRYAVGRDIALQDTVSSEASDSRSFFQNNAQILNDVMRQLRNERNPQTFGFTNFSRHTRLQHKVIGLYPAREGSAEKIYVVTSTNAASSRINHCHGCLPSVSVFLYRRNEQGWFLEARRFHVGDYGTWGMGPEKSEISVLYPADGLSALSIRWSMSTMGWMQESYALILHDNSTLWQSFSTRYAADNGGSGMRPKTDWKTKISFREGENRMRDIVVHHYGINEGRRVNDRIVYRFTGSYYESRHTDPLGKLEDQ